MCAGYYNRSIDVCKGDSGGPLTCSIDNNWTLIGITSWGLSRNQFGDKLNCGTVKSPSVYAKVSKFTNWIENVLKQCINIKHFKCKKLSFKNVIR